MRFCMRWKTGLDRSLAAATRERLTLGMALYADRVARVVVWREFRGELGRVAPHWVVRVELHDGRHLVVTQPDPGDALDAAVHVSERVLRALARSLDSGVLQ